MKTTGRFFFTTLAIGAVAILFLAGVVGAADDVCPGIDKEGRVSRLGGDNAVVNKALKTRADLTAFGREYSEILGGVLLTKGLGDATKGVLTAIDRGEVSEIELKPGDTLEWMATRKTGVVTTFGPVCMASDTSYEAWQFDVMVHGMLEETIHTFVIPKVCGNLALAATKTLVKPPIPAPVVFLSVDRDCETGLIAVDTGNSDQRAQVAVMTAEGIGHPVEAGSLEDPAPFEADLTFRIVAENTARDGKVQRTEKEVIVPACPAPPAACTLTLNRDDFFVRQPIVVNANGHWVDEGLALAIFDGKGREVENLAPGSALPYTTTLSKPGLYRIQGEATNEIGKTSGCEATVFVRPRWNLRPKLAVISSTDSSTGIVDPNGDPALQGFGTGLGLELDLEYHPIPLIGLEIGVLGGSIDADRSQNAGFDSMRETDSLGVTMAHFGLNFHFRGYSGADFFLGPVVALVDVDDASFGSMGDWQGGSDTGVGAQLGLDLPLDSAGAWNVTGGIRYLDASFDDDALTGAVGMDPLIVGIGLSYGF